MFQFSNSELYSLFYMNSVFMISDYYCRVPVSLLRNGRYDSPFHKHEETEIQIYYNGSVRYFFEDDSFVDVAENQFIVIGSNVLHKEIVLDVPQSNQSVCIGFTFKRINDKDIKALQSNEGDDIFKALSEISYACKPITSEINKIIEEIVDEIRLKAFGYYNKIQHLYALLIIEMGRLCANDIHPEVPKQESRLILDNYFDEIRNGADASIYEISRRLRLSPKQANRFILKSHNRTFAKMVLEIKISLAQSALINSNETIEKISETLGFSEMRSFSRAFKRETGMSPSQFRKWNAPPAL